MKQTITTASIAGVLLILAVGLTASVLHSGGTKGEALAEHLMELENQMWSAWANADASGFDHHLSDEAMMVLTPGVFDRSEIIASIESGECEVSSFELANPRLLRLSDDAALVTYDGYQQAVCGEFELPAHVYSTSVYVRQEGEWKNAFYQETVPLAGDQ